MLVLCVVRARVCARVFALVCARVRARACACVGGGVGAPVREHARLPVRRPGGPKYGHHPKLQERLSPALRWELAVMTGLAGVNESALREPSGYTTYIMLCIAFLAMENVW